MNPINNNSNFAKYYRQIAAPEFGEVGQAKLINSRVLIIGCGGLGTLASSYLVASGVGALVISDNDSVEISNLPRQLNYKETDVGKLKTQVLKNSLLALSPTCRIRTIDHRMDAMQLFLESQLADVVVDCSDNFATRHLINKVCYEANTPLVSGSSAGWAGQIATYHYDKVAACYHCLIDPKDLNQQAPSCESEGVIGAVVGVIASMQAVETIKLLSMTKADNASFPTILTAYNALHRLFDRYEIQKNPSCPVCSKRIRGDKHDHNNT
jgi:sulfur carrier protein ThiS adenylyltransferase